AMMSHDRVSRWAISPKVTPASAGVVMDSVFERSSSVTVRSGGYGASVWPYVTWGKVSGITTFSSR
ncbi:hypothetical protein BaRGS_00016691, partial [Batillaria attramentaria]